MAAARYRLLGEIQHRNDRIRLHLVVIETASGEQVWSRMYDRPFEEMTAIADESTADLAKALAVKVTEAEAARIRRRDTNSAEAYDLFLRAQSNLLVRRKEENLHARRLYSQALALDPAFARALGGIALTYAAEYRNRWASDGDSALALSKETAKQAAALNPELPEVLWVLAYVHVREGDHDSALGYLNRSIALDPSFADAYALKGSVMTYKGKPADAIQLLSRAMRLNPRAGYRYRLSLGRAFFYLEDNGHAIRNLREAAARNPANLEVRLYLAAALFHGGDQEAADWEALEIANLEADFSTSGWLRTHPIREPDQIERLTAALQGLGL
jgi:tetratricopeptide (TPR) repeat protein